MFRSVVWGYGLQIQLTDAQTNSIEGNMSSASLRITGFSLQFDSLSYTKAFQVFEKGLILEDTSCKTPKIREKGVK